MTDEVTTIPTAELDAVAEAVADLTKVAAEAIEGASQRAEARVNEQQTALSDVARLLRTDPDAAESALNEVTTAFQYQDILRQQLEAVAVSLSELAEVIRTDWEPSTLVPRLRQIEPRTDIDPDQVDPEDAGPAIELF